MLDKLLDRGKDLAFKTLSLLGRHPGRIVECGFAVDNTGVTKHNLLDVGSAGSFFPLQMAKRGFKVTAVDVRPYSQTHQNLKFIQADITKLPFPSLLTQSPAFQRSSTLAYQRTGICGTTAVMNQLYMNSDDC